MFRSRLVRAVAVAQRRRRIQTQARGLIGEDGSRDSSQQDCRKDGMPEPAGYSFHDFILEWGAIKTDSAQGGKSLVFGGWTYCRIVPLLLRETGFRGWQSSAGPYLAIPRRRTDRRHYSSWPVPVGDIALMAARAARMGVTLCQVEDLDKLHRIVAQSIWDHMTYDYLAELTEWSGRYASVAGVPARNVPVADPNAKIPGRLFAGPALPMPPGSSSAEDNAVVLALGTKTDDRLAQLRAGEATSVVLLTATSMGLASCPVTEPLEIAETREAVYSDIFGASSHPQMLLRVGWPAVNADPLPATPRRELSELLEWTADPEQGAAEEIPPHWQTH